MLLPICIKYTLRTHTHRRTQTHTHTYTYIYTYRYVWMYINSGLFTWSDTASHNDDACNVADGQFRSEDTYTLVWGHVQKKARFSLSAPLSASFIGTQTFRVRTSSYKALSLGWARSAYAVGFCWPARDHIFSSTGLVLRASVSAARSEYIFHIRSHRTCTSKSLLGRQVRQGQFPPPIYREGERCVCMYTYVCIHTHRVV